MSNRIYQWKCDKCDELLSSRTNYPPNFEDDDFTCKKCKTGIMLAVYGETLPMQ